MVNGERETKLGKPVMLSGAKAFVQRLEEAFIAGYRTTKDVQALVDQVIAANEKNLDVVEWCRVREEALDLSLRVYASRGSTRLHLSLVGPVGRYADRPLPERASAPVVRARAKKPAASASPVAPAVAVERVAPPAEAIVLRPIAAGAQPNYGDAIAFDVDGRLFVSLRIPDAGDYHVACVEPSGAVTLTRLPTRDALRAEDPGAMTGGLMPEVHATGRGLVRIEHYDHASGMKERVGLAGQWHASRRGLWSACWVLGVRGEWFLRFIVNDKKGVLLGVNLANGKRVRVALPEGLVRGAALDGEVLRVLGDGEERRYPIDTGSKLGLDLAGVTVVPCALVGAVQPVPNSGGAWVVMAERELRLVTAEGHGRGLFSLPAGFTGEGYAPWGSPMVTEIVGAEPGACSWLVAVDFDRDDGPRCRGVLVFTLDGAVHNCAYTDPAGVLRIGGETLPLGDGEHVCGYAAGPPVAGRPSGELAAVLHMTDGLALVWAPPVHARK